MEAPSGRRDPTRSEDVTPAARLFESLRHLYEKHRLRMKKRWDRDLPFDELLFDRFQRARNLGFGEGSSVYHNSYVYGDVKVGRSTWIGPFTLLDGTGGLEIGDWCSISAGVQIYTHDSVKWALSGGKLPYERSPVRVGNRCYIGSKTVIAKGVTIGDQCVVGACSFVNKSLPPNSIAAGIPCKVIGTVRTDDEISFHYHQVPESS